MNIRDFIIKLQNLPENNKKIILWAIVAILAVVMGFFWVRSAIDSFTKMGESVKLIEFPSVDIGAPPLDAFKNLPAEISSQGNLSDQTTPSNIK